jgi:ATP-dependent DNA helicase RecQ
MAPPTVDPRQLPLPFGGSKAKAAQAKAPKASAARAKTAARKQVAPSKSKALSVQAKALATKKPVRAAPPPVASPPVPFNMARLKERIEQEEARRKEAAERAQDAAPDSTLRALPVGVRRGRLTPRGERIDGASASSPTNDLEPLDQLLGKAGVAAEAVALRSYLLPWLNGGDVLAFVPADRAALIGCCALTLVNRKRTILVLPTNEIVADQVATLRSANIDVVTLPSTPDERQLEIRRLRGESTFVLVVSLERLLSDDVLDECRVLSIDLLAIDESHRVSELAPDFDPSVERLADLAPRLGRPPTLALLRAVPPSVRSDLPHRLGLRNPLRVDLPPVHESLGLDVLSTDPNRRTSQVVELLRTAQLPAVVLGYSMADVNDAITAICNAGMDGRRFDAVVRPTAQELSEPAIWVVATGRVATPIQFARTLVHFRSPPSLEQYCRDLAWVQYSAGNTKSVMFVANDDESMVKGTLERQRPRAEDLIGIAGVLARHGANASTVLLDSLCPAVGMNRQRVESLVSIFGRMGWVDHSQDWIRLRPDCPDLVERARGLGARLKTAKERDSQRLRSVSAYVVSRGCRQESLRRHFGTAGSRPCGICDACLSGRNTPQASSGRSADEGQSPVSRVMIGESGRPMTNRSDGPAWVHRRRWIQD